MQEKSWHEGYTFCVRLTGKFAQKCVGPGNRSQTRDDRHRHRTALASSEKGALASQGKSTGINRSRHGQDAIKVIAFVLQQFCERIGQQQRALVPAEVPVNDPAVTVASDFDQQIGK